MMIAQSTEWREEMGSLAAGRFGDYGKDSTFAGKNNKKEGMRDETEDLRRET